jgi:hypothetical protein
MLKLLKWGENAFGKPSASISGEKAKPPIDPSNANNKVNDSGTNYFSKYIKTSNKLLQAIINKSEKIHCEKSKKRVKDILVSIIKKDRENLRNICFEGLPDDLPIFRSLIWKINLSYLGMDVDKWELLVLKKRTEYEDIKMAFMLKMEAERKLFQEFQQITQDIEIDQETAQAHRDRKKSNSNSLSGSPSEKELKIYIKYTDKNLLEEIDKDVRRTHTDLNFFFMPSKIEDMKKLTNEEISEVVDKRRSNDVKTIDDIYISGNNKDKFETHGDVICRILYIYAKLNPDINYVQGMNELISPIYYCYSFDENENQKSNLEADTFWSFTYLMDDIKVLFMRNKDDTREGIFKKIELLEQILLIVDKDIYNHFKKHNVELSHFAFKWFILFFTQDFILPDVMRLWDAIFCIKDRFYYLFYISLAVMKIKKPQILKCDFAGIIIHLQNLDDLEIETILSEVVKIKKEYDKKIKKILDKNSGK